MVPVTTEQPVITTVRLSAGQIDYAPFFEKERQAIYEETEPSSADRTKRLSELVMGATVWHEQDTLPALLGIAAAAAKAGKIAKLTGKVYEFTVLDSGDVTGIAQVDVLGLDARATEDSQNMAARVPFGPTTNDTSGRHVGGWVATGYRRGPSER